MEDLKGKTIRGGFARFLAQGANFVVRFASLMVLARLLGPKDFGLVGMVLGFTGVLALFRDFGLSSAAIQRASLTDEQVSTLFWINVIVGLLLTVLSLAVAPAIAGFYHEPRLFGITIALSAAFLINSIGVQHGALLQRQMRFTALAVINTIALVAGTAVGIGAALAGYGYWALVAMTLFIPLACTIGFWLTAGWIPGPPRRKTELRSMMRFGGTLTLNGLVLYLANNCDKILLGRFWGANVLGIYGRAYQLINIPTDNLNSAAGEVAFAALSRLQDDPQRLKSYFLKGYSLVLAFTIPITISCAIFANDIILVLLGPMWKEAIPIFRLLAPTILVFAIANPLGWLLSSLGLVGRGLRIALVISPIMIASYFCGLPYGPQGVAFAYSTVMVLWVIPAILWCIHGTMFSFMDILRVIGRPLASVIPSAGLAFAVSMLAGHRLSSLPRLVLECAVLFITYALLLLFVAGEKAFYLGLLRGLRQHPSVEEDLAAVL